jgi:hypothetical protein
VHRSGRLDVASHPLRTPPRTRVEETAVDLAHLAATFDDAFGWISRPCCKGLTTPALLGQVMQSRSKIRWRTELTLALADVAEGVHSPLEYRYVRNVERAHGLPVAKRQVLIARGGHRQYLDNLYQDWGLGVELDGQAFHPAEDRWQDIGRDNALAADGIVILRYGCPMSATGRVKWRSRSAAPPTTIKDHRHCSRSSPSMTGAGPGEGCWLGAWGILDPWSMTWRGNARSTRG